MEHQPTTTSDVGVLRVLRTARHNMAFQDGATLVFHSFMALRVAFAPDSPDAFVARRFTLALLLVTASTVILVRGEILRPGKLRSLVYRVGLFTPIPLSYFSLHSLLPALQPQLLDMQLWAIDDMLFGITPSLWLNQINQPAFIEWFSFFYYSYFYLMVAMLIPPLFFDRGRRLQEVMLGAMTVAALGHVVYTLVPGMGPYTLLEDIEPIHGGFFWQQVVVTVESAGAQLDIFPSLHTAYPVFFALHCFGWRKTKPHKYIWPIVAFIAANIIVATMLLRWHWGIDVIAGLCLAVIARIVPVVVARREVDRTPERQAVWEPLLEADDEV